MTYTLGPASRRELDGVHPDLAHVVVRAIAISTQDFSVHDGIRTVDQQRELVARGASKTMNSKHLPQADGFGYAVDLVPYVNGKLRWEWPLIYPIADAMRQAGREFGVSIRWGGHWGSLTHDLRPVHLLVDDYVKVRRKIGKQAFIDGPHYELGA